MPDDAHQLVRQLQANVSAVVLGKQDVIRLCVVALLAGEHVLLEDVPGVGKTLIAKALCRSLSGRFCRIQDASPADSDDHIAAGLATKPRALVGCCNLGFTVNLPCNSIREGDRRRPGAGDNEGSPSETRNDVRQLPHFTLPVVSLLRNAKRERHHEYGSGKTLVNFSLTRGVTSKASTSARHFA